MQRGTTISAIIAVFAIALSAQAQPAQDFAASAMFNVIHDQYVDGTLSLTQAADLWADYVENRDICVYEMWVDCSDPSEAYFQRRGDWVNWFDCVCPEGQICVIEDVTARPAGVCAPVTLRAALDANGNFIIWSTDCDTPETAGCLFFDLDDAVNEDVEIECRPAGWCLFIPGGRSNLLAPVPRCAFA